MMNILKFRKFFALCMLILLINCSLIKANANLSEFTHRKKLKKNASNSKNIFARNLHKRVHKSADNNVEIGKNMSEVIKQCYNSLLSSLNPEFCWIRYGNIGKQPIDRCDDGWYNVGRYCRQNCKGIYDPYWLGKTCKKGNNKYKPAEKFFTKSGYCPFGYYKSNDLCYFSCSSINMTKCGPSACASDKSSCLMEIGNMAWSTVLSIVSIGLLVGSGGASAPLTPTLQGLKTTSRATQNQILQTVRKAFTTNSQNTIRTAKKDFMSKYKDKSLKISAEVLFSSVCSTIYNSISDQLKNKDTNSFDWAKFGKSFDIVGVNDIYNDCKVNPNGVKCTKSVMNGVSLVDPTGLLGMAAAYVHPYCGISVENDRIDFRQVLNYFRSDCKDCYPVQEIIDDAGDLNLIYLDRHKVKCPEKSALNSLAFMMRSESNNKLVTRYRCIKGGANGSCLTYYTDYNDLQRSDGSFNYLDRHKVQCINAYSVLSALHIQLDNPGNPKKFRFVYQCCITDQVVFEEHYSTNPSLANDKWNAKSLLEFDAIEAGNVGAIRGFKFNTYSDNKKSWNLEYSIGYYHKDHLGRSVFSTSNSTPTFSKKQKDSIHLASLQKDLWVVTENTVKCPEESNSAISGFEFIKDPNLKDFYRYNVECLTNKRRITNECKNYSTPKSFINQDRFKSIHYLDRHNVQCPNGEVLRNFKHVQANSINEILQIYIHYTCCKAQIVYKFKNRNLKTRLGDYSLKYLLNQKINLGPDEVLSGFHLETYWDTNELAYSYEVSDLW